MPQADNTSAQPPPSSWSIQAAIAALHDEAPSAQETDWRQVRLLYDELFTLTPTPVVALNRAIALAERDGPAAALALLDDIGHELEGYHLFHAARADLLQRLGRRDEALTAYDDALRRTANGAERDLLALQRAAVAVRGSAPPS